MRNQIGSARTAIELVLKRAMRPLTSKEVSDLSGVSITVTKAHLTQGTHRGSVINENEGKGKTGQYVWNRRKSVNRYEIIEEAVTPRHVDMNSKFTGLAPIAIRPGSSRAFTLPSRMGNELREYRTCVREI